MPAYASAQPGGQLSNPNARRSYSGPYGGPTGGAKRPLDVHEIIPRSAWAAGYLVDANTVVLCRRAHCWVDDHPTEAHALGLHGFSWQRPDRSTGD